MHRHDLVYLQPEEAFTMLNASLPLAVIQAVDNMIMAEQPFTVCRQSTQYLSKVATSHIENNCKYRLALQLSNPPKVTTLPLALENLIPSLPNDIQQETRCFIDQCRNLGADIYVYGSFANQYFTNLPFVNPTSDLDILIIVNNMDMLARILVEIEIFKQFVRSKVDLRIDGEVRLNSHNDVSFNELIHALISDIPTVLVKTIYEVELQTIDVLLGWNTYECEYFIRAHQRNLIL
ncbi:putative malonate decarboxylase, subunit E [Psychrobacter arcticus 273-4]|uniref:Putative malonate decarboxylase, subunit E n=1 Tax=Psychrobacter arcticus (strain DSM 17307 / VKM B-2377 / 273-4) TaxID=259536 RepID=Q4FSL5_PSYA2|nr:malonate decarboxylase holo-[acyl-carrier-protein] synthase [Psychrobacter arcticus]AAZ18993.1 putative malonate decarboxylase, subunit E [Psychrobacter arcticus 273-4]